MREIRIEPSYKLRSFAVGNLSFVMVTIANANANAKDRLAWHYMCLQCVGNEC